MTAMKQEVASLEGIGNLIAQAPALWDELSGSFKTDLALDEILSLGTLVQGIPRDNMRFGVIDNLYVNFGTTATGDQVLFSKYAGIDLKIDGIKHLFMREEDILAVIE